MAILTITEYVNILGTVTESNIIRLTINEFDTGITVKSLITQKGSILAGSSAGVLVEHDPGTDGQVIVFDSSEADGLKNTTLPTGGTVSLKNRTGSTVLTGSPVVLDFDYEESFKTTNNAASRSIIGVAAEDITDLSYGDIVTSKIIATVRVTGAVAVGQWLVQSTTAGLAQGSNFTKPTGAIGYALTVNASGTGTVSAIIDLDTYYHGAWGDAITPVVFNQDYDASGYTIRQLIPTAAISRTGLSKVRLTLKASLTKALTVAKVYIGQAADSGDAYDFYTTPTQLLFSGVANFALSAGEEVVSDEVTFSIPAGKNLVVSFYINGDATHAGVRRLGPASGYTWYSRAGGDDAATINASEYSTVSNEILLVRRIEAL